MASQPGSPRPAIGRYLNKDMGPATRRISRRSRRRPGRQPEADSNTQYGDELILREA